MFSAIFIHILSILSFCVPFATALIVTGPAQSILVGDVIIARWIATTIDPISFSLALRCGGTTSLLAPVDRGRSTNETGVVSYRAACIGQNGLQAVLNAADATPLAQSPYFQVVDSAASQILGLPDTSSASPSPTHIPTPSPSVIPKAPTKPRLSVILSATFGTLLVLALLAFAGVRLQRFRRLHRAQSELGSVIPYTFHPSQNYVERGEVPFTQHPHPRHASSRVRGKPRVRETTRAEIERLRRELAVLRAQQPARTPQEPPPVYLEYDHLRQNNTYCA
ncbi:hypothetical protein C8R44DRAFT_740304 [Mycena epipterygia]|nr:hypothetical protein C8R44DRAFT_740304 [Mycena epipterygia]